MNEFSRFLKKYAKLKTLRLFMPGHQGKCRFLNKNISPIYDITEIEGADNLYFSSGIIEKLEDEISKLYGSLKSFISAGGSTLCMQSIIWLLKNKKFIANRGAHISFYNACALFSISPIFVGNGRKVNLEEIEKAFLKVGFGAVLFVTSPNYYGEMLDIAKIKEICVKNGAILVVDGAHGAHYRFLEKNLHPISLGADFCFDSFHKTLPTLTGSAVLHVNSNLFKKEEIKKSMAIFGSSSPSYLVMHSIGLCVDWLKKNGFKSFFKMRKKKENLIKSLNLNFLETDPCKVVVNCFNVKGGVLKVLEVLKKEKIEPEFHNETFVCFIVSPFLKRLDWFKLKKALKKLNVLSYTKSDEHKKLCFKRILSLNEALYAEKEVILVKDALNRVCGEIIWGSMPGSVFLSYGELIEKEVIKFLIKRQNKFIVVVKKF